MIAAQPSVVLLFYSVLNLLQNDGKTEGMRKAKNLLKTLAKSSKQRYVLIVGIYKQPTDFLFKGLLLSGKAG